MKFLALAVLIAIGASRGSALSDPASWTPIEKQVADAAAAPGHVVTVVHFWAPWCPNCLHELDRDGWHGFIAVNPDVNVIFVTIWSRDDGKETLEKNHVGQEKNFKLLPHPNTERTRDARVNRFLGEPIEWVPTTWIMRDGELRYALNYGEVRFPLLQQLVRDASGKWDASIKRSEEKD